MAGNVRLCMMRCRGNAQMSSGSNVYTSGTDRRVHVSGGSWDGHAYVRRVTSTALFGA